MRNGWPLLLLLVLLIALGCNYTNDNTTTARGTSESAATSAARPAPAAGKLGTAAEGSKIEFVGTKTNGRHDGGFTKFTVTLDPVQEDISGSKVIVDIDTDSLWSDNPKLTAHLKSPDFFDVKKYPKATFVSSRIEPAPSANATHLVTGDLTLHGQTKTISFPVKVATTAEALDVTGEFTINRHDFGISYGKGRIHDDVTIKIAVRIPRQ
ncbi:MAG TPA: YceI family protein [Gemmataceae bacterium]|nr:YceI family protein [Gemmataceae bacterium]